MPAKRYIVRLTEDARTELLGLIAKGTTSARLLTRACILLKADEGWKDKEIAQALNSSVATIERIRQRFVEGNLDKALHDDPRPGAKYKLVAKIPTWPWETGTLAGFISVFLLPFVVRLIGQLLTPLLS